MTRWPRRLGERANGPDGPSGPLGGALVTSGSTALGGAVTSPRPGAGPATVPAGEPAPPATADSPPAPRRGPRRARLALRHVDPWSVLKVSFLFSLALLIILIVAVAVLYLILDTMGVFTSIDKALRDLTTTSAPSTVTSVVSFPRVVGGAAVLGAINVLLFTGLATLGAFLYNLCASIGGGVEVTLSERQ